MKRRPFVRVALGLGALAALGVAPGLAAACGPGARAAGLRWQRRTLLGFGTTLSLQAAHEDEALLDRALDAAVALLRRVEAQMSLFDPASALSHLNRERVLRAPPAELLQVLQLAQRVSRASAGAFDVTVQPLWQAFAAARLEQRLPEAREVAAARARVDWRALQVAPHELRLLRAGMAVTLNGIAQGYAADRVRALLAQHGIRNALIDAGEFAPLGHNMLQQPWTLGIADPRAHPHADSALLARLVTDGRCVATSADSETAFSADRRHHHIVDPHTGYSPPGLAAVTVVAPSGALADALTKVMFVAGSQRVPELARRWGVDVLWVDKRGRWQATPGLRV